MELTSKGIPLELNSEGLGEELRKYFYSEALSAVLAWADNHGGLLMPYYSHYLLVDAGRDPFGIIDADKDLDVLLERALSQTYCTEEYVLLLYLEEGTVSLLSFNLPTSVAKDLMQCQASVKS